MKFHLLLLLGGLIAPCAWAQNIDGPPYIAVHGTAETRVVPDLFPLTLTLADTSKDIAKTQGEIEDIAKSIVTLAKDQQVTDADLTVGNLSIEAQTKFDESTDKDVFIGNQYRRDITIRFHSLEKLKAFLVELPKTKQMRADTDDFTVSKMEEIKVALTAKAIANARALADEMAKETGKKIVGIQSVSNQGFNIRYSETYSSESSRTLEKVEVTGTRIASAKGNINLSEGTIDVTQDIYIVYLLSN